MAYPSDSGTTYTTKSNGQIIDASDVNNLQTEVTALKTKVGTNGDTNNASHDYKLSEVTSTDKAVGKTATQTLTNKTLTSPSITTPTITTPVINGNPTGTFVTAIANGGTGQTTASNAINALVPTQTGNSGRFLTTNGSAVSWAVGATPKFGGDGSDGALTITSGATNIDLGGSSFFVRNYTSISITGTGSLTFTNPASTGTVIILKSQGDVTLTSSATPMINASSLGAAGGTAVTNTGATSGNNGTSGISTIISTGAGAGATSGAVGAGGTAATLSLSNVAYTTTREKYTLLPVASGGGSGSISFTSGSTSSTSGAGGRGGGTLLIECAGAWNFTTASGISVAGASGGNASGGGVGTSGASGGGGGAGGYFIGLYNTLTANSGTVTVSGGTGGNNDANYTAFRYGGGGGSLNVAGSSGGVSGSASAKTGGDGATGVSVIAKNVDFS